MLAVRHHISSLIAPSLLAVALFFPSCSTTEENYRTVYESARQKRNEGLTEKEVAGMLREENAPGAVYKGDSIPLKAIYVKPVAGIENNIAGQYNVVVASFKQRFNANSVFERLKAGGYGSPVMLVDKDERYYVAAAASASLDTALAVLRKLEQNSPVALRAPFPYVLKRP